MAIDIARWQFSMADYISMYDAGILREDDRFELVDGSAGTFG
jgi:hypothetical protein